VTVTFLIRIEDPQLAEVYATATLTPVLFIFAELIPKNIMYFRADQLLPRFSWFIWSVDRLFMFSGVKGLLKKISNVLAYCFRLQMETTKAIDVSQRHQVRQIIHETQEEGLLSQTQREMMTRLINFPSISIATVMVHLRETHKISVTISFDDLVEHLSKSPFTRQIVYAQTPMNILGYITIYDVLNSDPDELQIQDYITPLLTLDKKTSVIEAINRLRNHHERIALVIETVKKETRPLGIITISDLVEEITGELNL
jgi:CBS domain containing-hemolysin-like protein